MPCNKQWVKQVFVSKENPLKVRSSSFASFIRGWYLTSFPPPPLAEVHYCLRCYETTSCTLTDCLKNKILKKFRNYLRPTSVAIYTLKETSSDLGLKRWNEPTVPSEKMVLDLAKSVKEWLRYWRFKTVDGFIHLQKFPFTESEDLPGSGSGGLVEDGLELPHLALALISLCLPENFWFKKKILKNELEDSKTTRWARK